MVRGAHVRSSDRTEGSVLRCYSLVKSIYFVQHRRVVNTALAQGRVCERRWQWQIALMMFLLTNGLLAGGGDAAERTPPIRIGVLTESWGPTPTTVGLRDGLLALGYREDEQFVLSVRFTRGDLAALPAAAGS